MQGFLGYTCYNCVTTETVHNDVFHFKKWESGLLNTEQIGELKHTVTIVFIQELNQNHATA